MYLPRKNGGRGLINITNHYKNAIINFSSYLLNSEEQVLKLTSNWQVTREEKSIHQKAQRYCDEIGHDIQQLAAMRKLPRKITIKSARINKLEAELKRKNMHGQFAKYLDQPHVDKERSNQWLKSSTLKRSTESTIAAIQEQAISIKFIEKHIFSVEDDDTCRICRVEKETIHHIISGCDGLSPTKYLERHDNVCKYIHVLLLLEHGFIEKYIPWYQHQPTQVAENNSTKILWNFSIQSDHEVLNNKHDIIMVDKINKTANLIEVAVPNDYNICNKRLQKIRAYTNLSGEIKTLWNLNKVQITPVIVGAMGTFYKRFDDVISKLGLMNHKF